ncbi:MAG: tRNA 2-thiocytidine(32) synthetase TtcA [Bacteroidaceae bacterium]|nr:tRNA 2-thiocytidine(32) synthetase TtcA [Bacteroidaceae bacterium]
MQTEKKNNEFEKRIRKRFAKAVKEYNMFQDGDKILVGLSGGKDSLLLLHLLAERCRIYKPRISVIAAHIRMNNIPYKSNDTFLSNFCKERGIELITAETGFDASTDTRKSPCFLCSWNRRKMLFTIAQEQGCNKIALGHNMDDFLETMLMNITFQGAFSAMAPVMQMRKFPISIIRPLCLVNENDVIVCAQEQSYPPQEKNCPYENDSNRKQMKDLLAHLETLNPEARYNMWGAMSNVQHELLPPQTNNKTNNNYE